MWQPLAKLYHVCSHKTLKNRYLHVNAQKDADPNWNITFNPDNGQLNGQLNVSQKETLDYIKLHQGLSATAVASGLGKPYRTIIKHITLLVEMGLIVRQGSKKTGGYY